MCAHGCEKTASFMQLREDCAIARHEGVRYHDLPFAETLFLCKFLAFMFDESTDNRVWLRVRYTGRIR